MQHVLSHLLINIQCHSIVLHLFILNLFPPHILSHSFSFSVITLCFNIPVFQHHIFSPSFNTFIVFMTSIYHTYSFTFSVITVFSSFFILIHIQFLDILPLFHILIHMHSHLMFTLFSSLHLITPMCSRSRLSHYSHSFLFSFFIYIFSSALTLLPLCHIIIHMHSHSMPSRCFHHFIS